MSCYCITGESDYLPHVANQDLAAYRDFMMQRLLRNSLVVRVDTSVVLDVAKQSLQTVAGDAASTPSDRGGRTVTSVAPHIYRV